MTERPGPVQLCYLCGEALASDEQEAHLQEQHGPRLLVATGRQLAEGATVRALFAQSPEWPVLAADILVLLHHGAAACGSALGGIQSDAAVAACLQEIDDAVASLTLARQVLTSAVLSAGGPLLGPAGAD